MSEKKYRFAVGQLPSGEFVSLPGVSVHLASRASDTPKIDAKPRATLTQIPDEETAGWRWAPWGSDDNLPMQIKTMIRDVPMASQAIYKLTQMMFGNGIAYYRNSELENGSKIQRAYIPAVEQFLRLNRINTHYLPAQFTDYRYFMNTFSELIFSKDKATVTRIFHKEAECSRIAIQDKRTLRSRFLLYSKRYQTGLMPQNKEIKSIYLYDWLDEESFLDNLKGYKMAWHSKWPDGNPYYACAFWLGLFRSNGWAEVSRSVPQVVNAMLKNQIILKYHILVPESYFLIRYQDWPSYTSKQREQLFKALEMKINSSLKGVENAFSSILTVFRQDEFGKENGKIEIEAVDDKVKKDAWVPSSDKADAQIVQGLGLHPSQVGLAPEGGKMGAGSGSDQREAFNTNISINTIDQEIILEPLNWIARFNAQSNPDWDITFFMDHTHHTTTNKKEDGMQPAETSIEVD